MSESYCCYNPKNNTYYFLEEVTRFTADRYDNFSPLREWESGRVIGCAWHNDNGRVQTSQYVPEQFIGRKPMPLVMCLRIDKHEADNDRELVRDILAKANSEQMS